MFLPQKCSSASALTLTLGNLIIKVGGRLTAYSHLEVSYPHCRRRQEQKKKRSREKNKHWRLKDTESDGGVIRFLWLKSSSGSLYSLCLGCAEDSLCTRAELRGYVWLGRRISSLLKEKTVLHEFKKACFLFPRPQKKTPNSVLRLFAGRVFCVHRDAICARVSGGARSVSGPVLVRTAPAHPAPWKPNFHAPSGSPSLTADPTYQSPSVASRVTANLGYDLAEDHNDWLVRKPAANDASRGALCPPMQRAGEATQGSGSKWSYI